jgi:ATP-dependent RNA helicase DBP3
MLDQGFEEAVRSIISCTAATGVRQTALFSATWPTSIQALAQEFLHDPVKVTVGGEDLSSNKRVRQVVEVLEERERDRRLTALLQQYHASRKNRVLIFALYKKECARLERFLQDRGWSCVGIHGDKSQNDRYARRRGRMHPRPHAPSLRCLHRPF